MSAVRSLFTLALILSLSGPAGAQAKKAAEPKKGAAEPSLVAATGVVDKADKETVVIKPRGADGRFEKAVTLKVTGTSKVAILSPQKRGDKLVLTQRDGSAADLTAGQAVAVIYAQAGKDGAVLLSAVAQPAQ